MKDTENPIKSFALLTSMSTYKIAKVTGISQPTVSRHVNGKQKISDDNLEKYAKHLSINKKKMLVWNEAVLRYQIKKREDENEPEWQ